MQEHFQFEVTASVPRCSKIFRVSVVVEGATVTLRDERGAFARGVWDTGHYVRYPRSAELPVHPQILDEVDAELRQRMTHRGEQLRSEEPRRSAIGY